MEMGETAIPVLLKTAIAIGTHCHYGTSLATATGAQRVAIGQKLQTRL